MVQSIDYATHNQSLSLTGNTTLPDIQLSTESVSVGEVEVTARLITRESDRFVVDVANNPQAAAGNDAVEMISTSPGVWVNDDQISINGNEGTRVMVNERLLTHTGDDLIAYLRTIEADNIQKIEIIPIAGADYDADSKGGIIKITLKKQYLNGMMGSLGMRYGVNKHGSSYSPSANISYHAGKLNVSGNLYLNKTNSNDNNDEANI